MVAILPVPLKLTQNCSSTALQCTDHYDNVLPNGQAGYLKYINLHKIETVHVYMNF